MKPKSHKDFKKGIAEKVGVHQNVVDDFISFYYAKLRKNLSDLTYPSININGIGTFHLRKKALDKAIKKNKSILGNLSKNTYMGYEKHVAVKDKLSKMENANQILNKIEQEKKEFKKNKK